MENLHPLRSYRKSKGLTLQAMASLVGIDASNLSRIETGKQPPSADLLIKVAEATSGEVTPNDMLLPAKEAAE